MGLDVADCQGENKSLLFVERGRVDEARMGSEQGPGEELGSGLFPVAGTRDHQRHGQVEEDVVALERARDELVGGVQELLQALLLAAHVLGPGTKTLQLKIIREYLLSS